MRKMYMKVWMLKLSAWVWVGGCVFAKVEK